MRLCMGIAAPFPFGQITRTMLGRLRKPRRHLADGGTSPRILTNHDRMACEAIV